MSTFRELFDEADREELLVAMQARLNQVKSRLVKAFNTETAGNASTQERLGEHVAQCNRIIRTIIEESN